MSNFKIVDRNNKGFEAGVGELPSGLWAVAIRAEGERNWISIKDGDVRGWPTEEMAKAAAESVINKLAVFR